MGIEWKTPWECRIWGSGLDSSELVTLFGEVFDPYQLRIDDRGGGQGPIYGLDDKMRSGHISYSSYGLSVGSDPNVVRLVGDSKKPKSMWQEIATVIDALWVYRAWLKKHKSGEQTS